MRLGWGAVCIALLGSCGGWAAESSLIALDGGVRIPLPLQHTEVTVDVAGHVASVDVTQVFENTRERPVEATYVFPLPDTAAIDALVVETGTRRIRGEIKPREEARATYDRAKREGRVAALLDQERQNVFTQRIAHLVPKSRVAVHIHYTQPLPFESGSYTLLIPLVVAERYTPTGAEATPAPAYLPPATRPGQDVAITVRLDAGVPLGEIASPSHAIDVQRSGPAQAVVTLAPDDRVPNKDFVLHWGVAGDGPRIAVLAHRTEGDGHFLMVLQPEAQPAADDLTPKELIFVLDQSGSMEGPPLEMVKTLAADAIGRLGPRDRFDVVAFSSKHSAFADQPVEASTNAIADGQAWVRDLHVEGGTELLAGLQAALRLPADGQRLRMVVLMTDAEVSNDDQVLTIERELGGARLFVIGVGTAVNHALGRRLASVGRGAYETLRPDGDAIRSVDRLFRVIDHPYLTDLAIDWGRLRVAGIEPDPLPDVYAGQPLVLAGRYEWGGSDTVIVRGRLGGVPWEQRLEVELPERETAHEAVPKLWARQAIDRLELEAALAADADRVKQYETMIAELALRFGLLTRFTSFVAVDEEEVANPGADFDEVLQAVPAPDLTEMVTVRSSMPLVSLSATAQAKVVAGSYEDLPVFGRDYQSAVVLAPGVADAAGGGNPNVNGSRERDFKLSLDGVSNVDPLTGQYMADLSADAIEEFSVVTSGADASYGGAVGGYGRVVTRSGSNRSAGSAGVALRAGGSDGAGPAWNGYQPSLQLNGPVKRDVLWYLFALDGASDVVPMRFPGAPTADGAERSMSAFGKLQWQIAPKHRLSFSIARSSKATAPYGMDSVLRPDSAADLDRHDTTITLGWQDAASPTTWFAVDVAYADGSSSLTPHAPDSRNGCAGGGEARALCLDLGTALRSGPSARDERVDSRTWTVRAEFIHFVDRWLGGSHDLTGTFSAQAARATRTLRAGPELAARPATASGERDAVLVQPELADVEGAPSVTRYELNVSDTYEPRQNVSLELGLCAAREVLDDARGTGVTDGALAPRASLSWDPFDDSRTKLLLAWRRTLGTLGFAPLLASGEPAYVSRAVIVDALGTEHDGEAPPLITSARLDPALSLPRSTEWTLSAMREIAAETTLELRYVRRDDADLGRTLAIDTDATHLVTSGRAAEYRGLGVIVDRRHYRGWGGTLSYVRSRWTTSGADASEWFASPRLDWHDAPGFAALDQRHVFKAHGWVTLRDRDRLRLSAVLVIESGVPYSTLEIRPAVGANGASWLQVGYPSG